MRPGLALAVAGAVMSAACDDAGNTIPAAPAASESSVSAVMRGEYLVRSVAGCGECHTPRDASGALDQSRWLGGVANRFDLVPGDDTMGGISAPNLTPAGLSSWSDDDIARAMLDGVAPDGSPLFPVMPYYAFHNMTAADAQAIVAYLRAIPPVAGKTPARQPLPVPLTAPAPPVPESAIPQTVLPVGTTDYEAAQRGRYLAGEVGFCLDCHTPWRIGETQPLDLTRVFAGGRAFSSHDWAVPSPAPAVVWSYDVTPDPGGHRRLDGRRGLAGAGRGQDAGRNAALSSDAGRPARKLRGAIGRGRARHRRLPHVDSASGRRSGAGVLRW